MCSRAAELPHGQNTATMTTDTKIRKQNSPLCLCEPCGERGLPRSVCRQSLHPRPQPPDQPAQHDQPNGDQLGAAHNAAEHRPASGIVAQELKEIAGHAIKEEVSPNYLSVELLVL